MKLPAIKSLPYYLLLLTWATLLLFLPQILIGFLISLLPPEILPYPSNITTLFFLSTASSLLLLFLSHHFFKIFKTNREELGLFGTPTWADIGLAPLGFILSTIAALALIALASLIIPWFEPEQTQFVGYQKLLQPLDRVFGFISLVVLVPFLEELIFRGFLYAKFRAKLSLLPSILITSLLFAALHFQLNVAIATFTMAIVSCLLREITGTIYASIFLHAIKNGLAFYLLFIMI